MTQPAEEELLIQAGNRQRQRQRVGQAMLPQVSLILIFLVIGCWLVFGVRLGPVLHHVAMTVGFIAFVIAGLLVPGAVLGSPLAPWGKAVRGSCPQCGRRTVRADGTMHFAPPASGRPTVRGTVTLCAADCRYAAVRDIKVNVDGDQLAQPSSAG